MYSKNSSLDDGLLSFSSECYTPQVSRYFGPWKIFPHGMNYLKKEKEGRQEGGKKGGRKEEW